MDFPFPPPPVRSTANHLRMVLSFNALNPVLVGWSWGKVDPQVPAFAAVEGCLLVGAMRTLPEPVRSRLEMVLGGPILSPTDWKRKLAEYLPRAVAVWLRERSTAERESWTLSAKALARLGKGPHGLSKKGIQAVQPLCDQPFPSRKAAEQSLLEALEARPTCPNRSSRPWTASFPPSGDRALPLGRKNDVTSIAPVALSGSGFHPAYRKANPLRLRYLPARSVPLALKPA